MCFGKKRAAEKAEKKEVVVNVTPGAEETRDEERGESTLTPEKLAEYKKKHPEEFPFTPEWNNLVQAENTKRTLEDTGLIH